MKASAQQDIPPAVFLGRYRRGLLECQIGWFQGHCMFRNSYIFGETASTTRG